MTFEELIKQLKQFENTDDYKNFISGLLNDERVTAYLETENGKKLMQPKYDSYFSKGFRIYDTEYKKIKTLLTPRFLPGYKFVP